MSLLTSALLAMAYSSSGVVVDTPSRGSVDLGYVPTANKHVAKRQKRKAARRREAAANQTAVKPYNQRNKKGRP